MPFKNKSNKTTPLLSLTMAILLLTAGTMSSCKPSQKNNTEQPVLSVSIFPVKNIIDRLTDNYYKVNVMIPKNIGHSDYSPTVQQMRDLTGSTAYLAIGPLDFELTWGDRLRSVGGQMKWIDISEGMALIDGHVCHHEEEEDEHHDHEHEHSHGAFDPHYWMSPMASIQMVNKISEILIGINPEIKEKIETNREEIVTELTAMHNELLMITSRTPDITFMIYHPALGYLARDYGLTQLEMEENGKAPTPMGLKRKIEDARKHQVKLLFIQKNFDINNAKVAAQEIGAQIVQINPESEAWMEEIKLIIAQLNHLK